MIGRQRPAPPVSPRTSKSKPSAWPASLKIDSSHLSSHRNPRLQMAERAAYKRICPRTRRKAEVRPGGHPPPGRPAGGRVWPSSAGDEVAGALAEWARTRAPRPPPDFLPAIRERDRRLTWSVHADLMEARLLAQARRAGLA